MASIVGSVLGASGEAVGLTRNVFLEAQSNPIRETRQIDRQANTIAQADPLGTTGAARAVRTQVTEAVSEVLSNKTVQQFGLLVEASR